MAWASGAQFVFESGPLEHAGHVGRQGGADVNLSAIGVGRMQCPGMQAVSRVTQSLPEVREWALLKQGKEDLGGLAIDLVPYNGVTHVSKVYTDLVCSAGFGARSDQSHWGTTLDDL